MIADIVMFLQGLVGCSHPQEVRTYFHTLIYKNRQVLPPQLYPVLSQVL